MRQIVCFCLFFCAFIGTVRTKAQVIERIGVETQTGWILAHSSDLIAVSQSQPFGFNLNYSRMNTSREGWEACNCFHYIGANLSYHNFNNPEVLGAAYGFSLFFEPVLWKSNRLELTLRSGMGLTYLNRVFDAIENPDNTFFSSPLSFLLFVNPNLYYQIAPQWRINLGLHYNHISNGGQKQPNRGINYPMIGLGVAHILNPNPLPKHEKEPFSKKQKWYIEAAYSNRRTQNDPNEGRSTVVNLAGGTHRSFTAINALGGGLELTFDQSLEVENRASEALMAAPYLAHHFLFGRFDFSQRMGIYLNKPSGYVDNTFYQRYLLLYGLGNNLHLGISLKAHGHVAENLDMRIGWKF